MSWTYVWDLTKPAAGDFVKQGDDEIRTLKAVLQERLATLTNFPNSAGAAIALLANTVGTAQITDANVTLAKMAAGVLAAANIAGGSFPAGSDYNMVRGLQLNAKHQLRDVAGDSWSVANALHDGVNWNRVDVGKYAPAWQQLGAAALTTDPIAKLRVAAIGANPIAGWTDLLTVNARGDATWARAMSVGDALTVFDDVTAKGDFFGILQAGATDSLALKYLAEPGLYYNMIGFALIDTTKGGFALASGGVTGQAWLYTAAAASGAVRSALFAPTFVDFIGEVRVAGVKVIGPAAAGWVGSVAGANRSDPNGQSLAVVGAILGTLINDLKNVQKVLSA